MEGLIHISFAQTEFNCPYCNKEYSDADDKYLNRLNKPNAGFIKIKCSCKNTFEMTYNMLGKAITFK